MCQSGRGRKMTGRKYSGTSVNSPWSSIMGRFQWAILILSSKRRNKVQVQAMHSIRRPRVMQQVQARLLRLELHNSLEIK